VKQIKKKTFIHQTSLFDFETLKTNPMRGFFTCFWVGMCIVFLLTLLNNYKQHGYFLGLKLAGVFSKDIISLIKHDCIMISSTFIVVPFQWILSFGILSPSAGTAIQVIKLCSSIASMANVLVLLLDIVGVPKRLAMGSDRIFCLTLHFVVDEAALFLLI
jgi:hypothetical protein